MDELDSICLQVAEGMEWLHRNDFVHGDLAARNVLLKKNSQGNIRAKIGDFGLSFHAGQDYINYDCPVPFCWSAPEVISNKLYTKESDVWSFGIVMWEIYTCGDTPYEGLSNRKVEEMLRYRERLIYPDISSQEVDNLMAECWHRAAYNRPTFEQIVTILEGIFYGDN